MKRAEGLSRQPAVLTDPPKYLADRPTLPWDRALLSPGDV